MYHYTYKLNYRFNMNRRKHNDITRTDYESITCSACNRSKIEIRKRVDFLKDYVKTGAKGFVLGISGGQDSTLAGRLAQLAVEEIRNEGGNATFIAVRLPYKVQKMKMMHN